jgi:beta-galactosidase
VETDANVLAQFGDGSPAVIEAGRRVYCAGWPDAALLESAMRRMLRVGGLEVLDLPPGVRLRRRGGLCFAFNYGPEPWPLPEGVERRFVLGGELLAPQDLACWHGRGSGLTPVG